MLQKAPKPDQPPVDESDIAAILKAGRPRHWVLRTSMIGGAVLVVLLGGWLWLSSGSSENAISYQTSPITRGDLTVTVTATGTVQPTNEVEISSELSGTIATVDADFNDHVTRNETLATLATDKLDAAVALSEATLTARQADVRQAQATVDETAAALRRANDLGGKGLASTETVDTAKAAAARAAAALASAKANLNIAEANATIAHSDREKATIVSPIDGVVLSRAVEVGQTVASSLQAPILFTLAEDLTKMQLQVDIDEADVGQVTDGDSASFTVEAYPGKTFPATISLIRFSPETVEGVVTYKAILTVDNTALLLRPGMTATADITVEQVKDTLLVPNAALRYTPPATAAGSQQRSGGLLGLLMPSRPRGGNGGPPEATAADGTRTLYVLRDGAPVAVAVKVGATDGTNTAVTSADLKAGDKAIVGSRSRG